LVARKRNSQKFARDFVGSLSRSNTLVSGFDTTTDERGRQNVSRVLAGFPVDVGVQAVAVEDLDDLGRSAVG
jgi:hypothetical protein